MRHKQTNFQQLLLEHILNIRHQILMVNRMKHKSTIRYWPGLYPILKEILSKLGIFQCLFSLEAIKIDQNFVQKSKVMNYYCGKMIRQSVLSISLSL